MVESKKNIIIKGEQGENKENEGTPLRMDFNNFWDNMGVYKEFSFIGKLNKT
jgi:hypothetical protein